MLLLTRDHQVNQPVLKFVVADDIDVPSAYGPQPDFGYYFAYCIEQQ